MPRIISVKATVTFRQVLRLDLESAQPDGRTIKQYSEIMERRVVTWVENGKVFSATNDFGTGRIIVRTVRAAVRPDYIPPVTTP